MCVYTYIYIYICIHSLCICNIGMRPARQFASSPSRHQPEPVCAGLERGRAAQSPLKRAYYSIIV